jgi:hypothetical protein
VKTGPLKGQRVDQASHAEKATAAWNGAPPDWIVALAERADANGLQGAGAAIGYSPSAVSGVLAGKYGGDLVRIEEKVRGALMGLTVECPVLGTMDRSACLDWQKKPLSIGSSLNTQMHRACRSGCPHSRIARGGAN